MEKSCGIFLILCCSILFSGCSDTNEQPISKWNYGSIPGWYPLTIDGEPIFSNNRRAFINSTSMIVDCRGIAIRQGKLFGFLQNNNFVALYNKESKNIDQNYPPEYVLTREFGKVTKYDYIHIDLSLRGNVKAQNPQC